MATVTVDDGVCGFRIVISVGSEDMQHAKVRIVTDRLDWKPVADGPFEVDACEVCFS